MRFGDVPDQVAGAKVKVHNGSSSAARRFIAHGAFLRLVVGGPAAWETIVHGICTLRLQPGSRT